VSRAKQKGTMAETAVVEFLKKTWPAVERRTLGGKNDKGDIAGVPNSVVEVKNQKSYKISEWLRETETEKANAGVDYGILVIKPNGVGVSKTDQWWAVVSLATITELVEQANRAKGLQPPGN
jgi:hypothetical protein